MMSSEVDKYLKALPNEQREALVQLRDTIWSAAKDAELKISYRIPMFHYCGGLVAFAAFKNHLSFMVMSTDVFEAHTKELSNYSTATATIHFTPDKPLPVTLVKKLVKARMRENEANLKAREAKKAKK